MIKNIILDIGNVVLEDSGEVLEKFLNISKEEVKRLRKIVYADERFTKCLLGEISQEEYKEELIKEYPDNKKEIEKLLEAKYQKEVLPIKQDTIDLMMQLKENYNLYFLSNLTQDSYYYIKELGITNLVKGGVYSFEAKEKKPQEAIYNILLERYQLNKAETIFFDDMPRNVEKGNELGIKSVIFKDTQDIIKALRQESLVDIHLDGQLELYMSNKISKKEYDIYTSNIIEDNYWNLAYLKTNKIENILEIWNSIKIEMQKINRTPLLYTISKGVQEKLEKSQLVSLYTDVWMIKKLKEIEERDSKIALEVKMVDATSKEKFIQAVMDGFSGDNPEDPYESLSEGYKIALQEGIGKTTDDYKMINFLGTYQEEAISTATVICKEKEAIIYNVTTNKKYQKQGVCGKTMYIVMKELKKIGIEIACVQTEKGFYTEQVYKNMGFEELMIGKAFIEK